jgi:hypothetical protein
MAGHIPDRILIFIPMRESGILFLFFFNFVVFESLVILPTI